MEMNNQERATLERQLGVIEGVACTISVENNLIYDTIIGAIREIDDLIADKPEIGAYDQ